MTFKKVGPYPSSHDDVELDALMDGYRIEGPGDVLQALVRIQHFLGWVPPQLRKALSERTRVTETKIRGIIDFYHLLDAEPTAPWVVHLSTNITDMMLGQQTNIDRFNKYAKKNPGKIQVNETSCTGLCEQGPALLINGFAMGRINAQRVDDILALISTDTPLDQWPANWFEISSNIRKPGPLLRHHVVAGEALAKVKTASPEDFILKLDHAGLKGRGGAGFSTAFKWQACRKAIGDHKVVACNADEGEPGTFKDRVLLDRHIENVLEGMTICGEVIGAKSGYIYLRKEYIYMYGHINNAIKKRREAGLLTEDFDIGIHMGAGAYVCGEESSMLDSMEGKRGIPRIKPPFPVDQGFLGRPTVVNNVETFCNVALLADKGLDNFRSVGCSHTPGSKLHSISGDCKHPGIYEFPLCTSIAEMMKACGGKEAAMVQVGGAAGRLITENRFDTAIDFRRLYSAGSMMVFNSDRQPKDLLHNFSHFFVHESCGFCTPCRGGCQMLAAYSDQVMNGTLQKQDEKTLLDTCKLMMTTSHCGLGKTAGQSIGQIFHHHLKAQKAENQEMAHE
ncbi:NAD(P)H-dependent oxidoreductase subunit E [Pelagibaculum spongiae]|uniref:NADH-quinone oxidoreductase subunit F n=1 Tax=Pelagibaculum spongiae TaxID=2080658 RepID=A0A2V1GRM0_9GAMM|nr:NAD(P)H-dependent oxidoreductase subunit E [Pelagibaculum spongiae]PVZ65421.1 NADP oxidoreductase [Pelagibaculum spongiae]